MPPVASKSLPVATRDVAEPRERRDELAPVARQPRLEIPVDRRRERQALLLRDRRSGGRRRSARGRRSGRSAPSSRARATACSRTADRECAGSPARAPDCRRRPARRATASLIASSVISWKTMRLTGTFGLRTSCRCQLIDSPSRSGSVARITCDASLSAAFSACDVLPLVVRDDVMRREVALGVDAQPSPLLLADLVGDLVGGFRQIAHVAVAGPHFVAALRECARSCAPSRATRRSRVFFAIPSLHPSTKCQPARNGRRRRGSHVPAVRARTIRGKSRDGLEPGSLGDFVEIARFADGQRDRESDLVLSRSPPPAPPACLLLTLASFQFLQHVVRRLHDPCAVAQQRMRAAIAAAEHVARHGEHVAPCSSAHRAVMSEPLFSPASITTTARDNPLMIRLRRGKNCACGGVPGTSSLTTAPSCSISRARPACSRGYTTSTPDPSIATVAPPPVSAPRCAAESTPRASPLTTTRPARGEIDRQLLRYRQRIRRSPRAIRRSPRRGG